jgi:hypothetical protein
VKNTPNSREEFISGLCENLSGAYRETDISVVEIVLDFGRKVIENEGDMNRATIM